VSRCEECGRVLDDGVGTHPQAAVSAFGMHAHVDEGIVGLIEACWWAGIFTMSSCQEDEDTGLANVTFAPGFAESFVGATGSEDLVNAPDEALGMRMRGMVIGATEKIWMWRPAGFSYGASFMASFPPSDIPELTRRLEAWP
jgi:hypothetical protein